MGLCCAKNIKNQENTDRNPQGSQPILSNYSHVLETSKSHNQDKDTTLKSINNIIINNEILVQKARGTPLEHYKIVKCLGEGAFGRVYLAKMNDYDFLRAIKEIEVDTEETYENIENEISILKKIDHPNIIKIFEFFTQNSNHYLVTEYCKEGDLFEKINELKKFNEHQASTIVYQILLALIYCHQKDIIHRDLKPENIMIEAIDSKNHYQIKIIDFGTAKVFDRNTHENVLIGSSYYVAPEVIMKKYNEKCDLWSLGVILYILLSGQPPFIGSDDLETFRKIKNEPLQFPAKKWSNISIEAIDLIKCLLERNPLKRLSATEAINHVWFQKNIKKDDISKEKLSNFVQSLKDYSPKYKLLQCAVALIVHNVPHTEDIKEMERAFRLIDVDKDGKLSRNELIAGFKSLFDKPEADIIKEVDEIFKNADSDQSGYLEYEEFVRGCIDKNKLLTDEYLKLAFNFFDLDSCGTITLDEIKEVFCSGEGNINESLLMGIIGKTLNSPEKHLNFEEFKTMMKKILNPD